MDLLEELEWRGLIQDISDPEALSKLKSGDSFYIGFDPTAPSLQVGNLVPLIVSIHLTRAGLNPIVLFGGATGMIGDPGGKNAERNLMELEQVAANTKLQEAQVRALWERSGCAAIPTFVNNITWTKDVPLLSFLRDIGKHFTINYMLAKDSVKSRLSADGISYTEFSYMLLQAFDFMHLFQNKGCRLQIGGSEQWGNVTAGLELIRRKLQKEAYAFSFPLITDSAGKKFGKSEGNAVWLDSSMTSPYKFHQFWLNIPDSDVVRFLKVFTFESKERIAQLEAGVKTQPEKRVAQQVLADALCSMVHGSAATAEAKRSAAALFSGSLEELSKEQLLELFADAPSTTISRKELDQLDLLSLLASTVAKSKGEARRLVQGGGIYLDSQRVSDGSLQLRDTKVLERGFIVLRSGKKNYHIVRIEGA